MPKHEQGEVMTVAGSGSLFKKLAAVTAAVGYVPKNGRNEFHKYDYVTEADLVEAIRKKLAEQEVAYLFSVDKVEVRETQNGPDGKPTKGGQITTAYVSVTFADGATGEKFTVNGAGTGQDAGDKGLYKAITGAQKYLLMKVFLVPTGDDPEGDTKVDQAATPEPKPARAHGAKAGVKPSDDPQELTIPSGKFKDRKVGSLSVEEAEELAAKVPGTSYATAALLRIQTLKALASVPETMQEALAGLDPEAVK